MRRRTVPAVLVAGAILFTGACGLLGGDDKGDKTSNAGSGSTVTPGATGGAAGGAESGKPQESAKGAAPQVTTSPEDGATGVDLGDPLAFAVEGGKITAVKVVNAKGEPVDGTLAADGKSWKPKVPFTPGGQYTVSTTATNADNTPTTVSTKFTTQTLGKEVTASIFPDGGTVGVGQPVSVRFDRPITNKAEAEKAMKVTATPAVAGAWHWFGNTRVEWRPKDYWKAGTKVKVDLNLRGVDLGGGAGSKQYKSFNFGIGNIARISTVDVAAKTMTTTENGKVVKTTKVTTGESPKYDTWGGVMVVMEKYTQTRMNSATVGLGKEYDIADVPSAVRITTSGTFVHGNYWYDKANPPFGRANTSHGCVSMTPEDAKWFYDHADRGDVVKVINSKERTVAADNGYGAWNLSWSQWLATSATKQ
ncbi:L,D-transpeptidase [Embleya scabrispora]|uniref:L,D-transpeptidase n=1 Tax=Embleya scabrispora TaxID=159449 RepID=UPI00037AA6E7|nr:Ig-like domain-containing protein [Embleya scabrispora]MYS82372.1 L,D-transpeptidase family protein [Streptomyces sp. SID5474]